MVIEILLAIALGLAVAVVCNFFESLWGSPSNTQPLPLSLEAPMSDYDRKMADQSKSLIRECFSVDGNNVVDSIRLMDGDERKKSAETFASQLAALNGLELTITFYQDNDIRNCGYYNYPENTAAFNIVELMWDGNDSAFEYRILNFLDTIVHELRHAVQFRAMRERGFWEIDDERRANWANNLPPRYITASIDPRAYRMQPLESDAFTYAELVLRGV